MRAWSFSRHSSSAPASVRPRLLPRQPSRAVPALVSHRAFRPTRHLRPHRRVRGSSLSTGAFAIARFYIYSHSGLMLSLGHYFEPYSHLPPLHGVDVAVNYHVRARARPHLLLLATREPCCHPAHAHGAACMARRGCGRIEPPMRRTRCCLRASARVRPSPSRAKSGARTGSTSSRCARPGTPSRQPRPQWDAPLSRLGRRGMFRWRDVWERRSATVLASSNALTNVEFQDQLLNLSFSKKWS